jgi:transposase
MKQHRVNEASRRLETIPGIRIIGASAIAATESDPNGFSLGSRFCGLDRAGAATGFNRRHASRVVDPHGRESHVREMAKRGSFRFWGKNRKRPRLLNLTGSNDLHSYRESRCYTEIAMELFCSVGVLSAWRTA